MSNSDGKPFRWRDCFIFTFEVRGVHSGETSKCWRKLWPCLKRKCSNRNSVKHQLMNNTHRPCRVDYMHVYIWSWFIYHERTIKCSSNHCIRCECNVLPACQPMYLHTSAQPIARVWGVATVAGWARGCLAGVEKENQIPLQKCKPKFKDLPKYTKTKKVC